MFKNTKWYADYRQNVVETRFFAEEPIYDNEGHQHAPSRVHVWACKNIPGLLAVKYTLRDFAMPLVCKVLGHKMVSENCISPESGSEDIWCERCGCGQHITYY